MNDVMLQLGVGGIFVLLLLKELLPFLLKRFGHHQTSGEQGVDFWKATIREIVDDSFTTLVKPTLEAQSKILGELRDILKEEQTLRSAQHPRRRQHG